MFWTTGLVLVALVFGQVPAELAKPVFIEDAIAGAGSAHSSRIVSGWQAYPGQHPHQTSLRIVDQTGGVGGCGGSIVQRNWVITAAHCTAGRITVVVRAGVTSLTTPQYIFETTEWWNHPTYNENFPGVVQPNDISILKLQRPVTYTRLLQPIRIQPSTEAFANYDNEVLIASGWGRLWTNGAQPEVLNWVYLRAISNQACAQTFGTALINDNAICARWYNVTSQSTCQGDSGGPLVHVNSDGVPVLVGIASFVAGGDWGCHSGLAAGFIRPGPFLPWLNDVTGLDFENLNEEDDVTEAPEIPTTEAPAPPTETPQPPTEATQLPTEISSSHTEAPQPPTEATQPPTEISSSHTEAPQPPTEAPKPPTEAPQPPTEAPQPPTKPTSPEPELEPESEESDEDSDDGSESEEDPEISELLKKLIVKVKVKVKINNNVKRKIKVKCVDKF